MEYLLRIQRAVATEKELEKVQQGGVVHTALLQDKVGVACVGVAMLLVIVPFHGQVSSDRIELELELQARDKEVGKRGEYR